MMKAGVFGMLVVIGAYGIFWGTVGFVLVHFIGKFW